MVCDPCNKHKMNTDAVAAVGDVGQMQEHTTKDEAVC